MLRAVFYARFHPERGPSVIHQYPPSSIVSTSRPNDTLIKWSEISAYIIPPYDLCNQPLGICVDRHRVLAFPVSLEHEDYHRNRFTFNICFVLGEDDDATLWDPIVRKTARFLTSAEDDHCFLQQEEKIAGLKWAGDEGYPVDGLGQVHGLLRDVFEGLNTYGECSVRINDANVLNLRLEAARSASPKVRAWDVPLLIRDLPSREVWTWDLTLKRIHTYIDGIKHVQKIAELADVELKLVKRVVKELVYHGRATLLDIFHFQAIYACTETVTVLLNDEELQDECRYYITKSTGATAPHLEGKDLEKDVPPTRQQVVELYTLLHPGLQLHEYCLTHRDRLTGVDTRRLITFGIIKGFLRRVHKLALALEPQHPTSPLAEKKRSGSSTSKSKPRSSEDAAAREYHRAWRRAALTSGWATPPSAPPPAGLGRSYKSADHVRSEEDERLRSYLDGGHCMDQICVEMHMSERKVVERLRSGRLGDVVLFNK
ncbi:Nitrogen permease regulator 2 [Fulvia fulva]|uniref:Nitrogen permease regulator 2 n=1 Tax=Passalora fulva TaxID=5499 RepID=A0A9Q8PI33_PASFU|nr:Nitrogen permease regulator 2 [Fulvia fulva]KAK4627057.1 Nitrogen permease regulator 2 [Fulvia fulva]KAK4628016.1 Nitrogen permease regulator 2 [Fulvia fulva]UJO22863.1 Nitrogen permease regulator 2 [Fulvia fulva]WPV13105.1 Nitrogen permease regulator 2 [Fulvia fulva]WPV28095.1 Nitrogen permease regulator 2 [Fulvia fulva]